MSNYTRLHDHAERDDGHPAQDVGRTVVEVEVEQVRLHTPHAAADRGVPRAGVLKMVVSSIALMGVSFMWTVELAYGTPYLKSLGLTNASMALVWLAGPISGLVMQPLIGAYSDKLTWKIGRRRPFILCGGIAALASLWVIVYAKNIAYNFIDDPVEFQKMAIWLAVGGFYALDFSINAVQACCRALLVDVVCTEQQGTISAIGGLMNNLGNLLGYAAGWLPLPVYFPILGHSQFQSLCSTAAIVFLVTVGITCIWTRERPKESRDTGYSNGPSSVVSSAPLSPASTHSRRTIRKPERWYKPLTDISNAFWHCPPAIQAICNVQFWSWLGWFPFLFYATTWVAQHAPTASSTSDSMDVGIRAGSFALLLSSTVSLIVLGIAPIIRRASNSVATDSEGTPNETDSSLLSNASKSWAQMFTLPKIWSASEFWYAFVMWATFFTNDLESAVVLVTCTGLSWGVTLWAPFTLIGEYVTKQLDSEEVLYQGQSEDWEYIHSPTPPTPSDSTSADGPAASGGPSHPLSTSTSSRRTSPHRRSLDSSSDNTAVAVDDSALKQKRSATPAAQQQSSLPTLTHQSPYNARRLSNASASSSRSSIGHGDKVDEDDFKLDAGLVLGIHNVYITLPQFISTFICAGLFWILDIMASHNTSVPGGISDPNNPPTHTTPAQPQQPDYDPFGWALRLSGIAAILAGVLARKLNEPLHQYKE
ncbi:hypothetical protein SeMB42_g03687 [Synchytrium endobioticum]|uniref:Major facilitator superfamily (MFS) profile domain-containing protein n=1 Tax=Synchytrium endobioticum TaxID=286115 RepID=A0A507D4U6_9FUNG|nr:hypothetical protein SeLEV6574_g03998 [Synchytrium endobioticum]TPX46456.1 hypothetical protein SeMB42_g03687 [Synchytrium endobioticum]